MTWRNGINWTQKSMLLFQNYVCYKENVHACSLHQCGEELQLTAHQRQSVGDVNKDGCKNEAEYSHHKFQLILFLNYGSNSFLWKHSYFFIFIEKNNRENCFFVFVYCIYLSIKHKAQILFQSVSLKQSNELMFQNIFITSADAVLANICCTRSENTHQPTDSAVLSRYDSLHTSHKIIPFSLQYLK